MERRLANARDGALNLLLNSLSNDMTKSRGDASQSQIALSA